MAQIERFQFGVFQDGDPVTGAGAYVTCQILQLSTGKYLDWDDNTFKSSSWVTLLKAMTEIDATNLAGYYQATSDISVWEDGKYVILFKYNNGVDKGYRSQELEVKGGLVIEDYLAGVAAGYIAPDNASITTIKGYLDTADTGLISLVNAIKGYLDTANTGLIAVVGAIRGFISDLWIMRGLDASNPKTIDKVAKTESAGGIVLDIDETDPTKTIVTREP